MIKAFLLIFISLAFTIVFWFMLNATIQRNEQTLQDLQTYTKDLQNPFKRPRLSGKEIFNLNQQLKKQIAVLNQTKTVTLFASFCLAAMIIWVVVQNKWQSAGFDGLALLIANVLLFNFHWLFYTLFTSFEEGHNAIQDIQLRTSIGLLLIQPILFFIAYQWNKLEIQASLHQQKWISIVAITLSILTGLIAIIIGIGVLFTPDLSGNIT